nr:uncharacterized protein LOC126518477 [Dermacentor andersoni]
MDAKNTYSCSRCHQRTHCLAALFRHLCASHGTESGWNCSFEGCVRTYRLYSSFRKHVSRHHKHLFPSSSSDKSVDLLPPDNTHDAVDEPSEEPSDESGDEPTEGPSDEPSDDGVLNASDQCVMDLSSLLLKWQEGRQLPESTVNEIANDVINFAAQFQATLNSVAMTKLEKLRSKSGRENYWKSLFSFVPPKTINLSEQSKSDCFEYIPILETIQAVSRARKLFGETGEGCSTLLRDVCDGTYYQEHSIFRNANSRKLIMLQLYFDDFEICNPLGSKRGRHKLLAGYLTILNFSPNFRSKTTDKYLVLLAKSSLVTKYSLPEILRPLIEDLQKLEENGIELNGEVVKGSLLFLMQQDPSLSSVYGITGKSCLSSLQSFDVTQGLPPDVMHDLFEGVMPFVMKHVIRHIISSRDLTLETLNERLASFPFQGADKKSRLPPLTRQLLWRACKECKIVGTHQRWDLSQHQLPTFTVPESEART